MSKFKVGDKVVPISKSVMPNDTLDDSIVWSRARDKGQKFLYVTGYNEYGDVVCYDEKTNYRNGDYFKESDLILYIPRKSNKQRIKELEYQVVMLKCDNQVYIDSLNELYEKVVRLEKQLEDKSKVTNDDNTYEIKSNWFDKLTPNQQRKTIINDAKYFVDTYSVSKEDFSTTNYNNYMGEKTYVEFVINEKKRVVVALLKNYLGHVVKRGIAKCLPEDVFNAHLGKAIALGKIFKLDTDKYANTVHPNKVVKGHTVKWEHTDSIYDILDTDGTNYWFHSHRSGRKLVSSYKNIEVSCKIINDSKAIYED